MTAAEGIFFAQNRLFHAVLPAVMGTRLEWVSAGMAEKAARNAWEQFRTWVTAASARLNRFCPDSEVSRFNAGKGAAGAELRSLMDLAEGYKERTKGLFDACLQQGAWDFGGLAKGWALRKAKDCLERTGCTSAFVNFGGSSILAMGTHPYGPAWKVALPDPYSGTTLEEWDLKDCCMSTSGNVPGYCGHIVDPRSGASVTERRLAVAVCPDAADAEVLSTVLMIERKEDWKSRFPAAQMKVYEL